LPGERQFTDTREAWVDEFIAFGDESCGLIPQPKGREFTDTPEAWVGEFGAGLGCLGACASRVSMSMANLHTVAR
jgi:hypothetical protein